MKALIDGDILRYEIGFGAEVGWKMQTGEVEELPPFHYVAEMLHDRIANICALTSSDEYTIFLTEGRTFRYDIAVTRSYKGQRKEGKPWHYDNLTAYISNCLPSKVVRQIEADDAIAIEHVSSQATTIVCSRDKDLRQLPGWSYSWELGRQPSFGPVYITEPGSLELSADRKGIKGTGFAFFCSQLLTGDTADNIPGIPGCGAVFTYEYLQGIEDIPDYLDAIHRAYCDKLGWGYETYLKEQGRLLWLARKLDDYGYPELWELDKWK